MLGINGDAVSAETQLLPVGSNAVASVPGLALVFYLRMGVGAFVPCG